MVLLSGKFKIKISINVRRTYFFIRLTPITYYFKQLYGCEMFSLEEKGALFHGIHVFIKNSRGLCKKNTCKSM